jgi:hypothetical protein
VKWAPRDASAYLSLRECESVRSHDHSDDLAFSSTAHAPHVNCIRGRLISEATAADWARDASGLRSNRGPSTARFQTFLTSLARASRPGVACLAQSATDVPKECPRLGAGQYPYRDSGVVAGDGGNGEQVEQLLVAEDVRHRVGSSAGIDDGANGVEDAPGEQEKQTT